MLRDLGLPLPSPPPFLPLPEFIVSRGVDAVSSPRDGRFSWEGLGVPESLIPAPFPFLPVPKGLIRNVEGVRRYRAWGKNGTIITELEYVYGEDEADAEEALENKVEMEGLYFDSLGVIRE